jgi:hypothetical protein
VALVELGSQFLMSNFSFGVVKRVVFVKTAPVSFANLIKSWRGRGPGGEKSSGVARDVNALRCGHLCRGFIDDPLDLCAS